MKNTIRLLQNSLFILCLTFSLGGCAMDSIPQRAHWPSPTLPGSKTITSQILHDTVSLFDGHSGEKLSWADLLDAVDWSQITLVGEQHQLLSGDRVVHQLIADCLARKQLSAVSLEMLYRDEATLMMAVNQGTLSLDDFARQTKRHGKKSWKQSYRKMAELAVVNHVPLIASNAPRKFVKMARTQGYDALRALPSAQQQLFELPLHLHDRGANFKRFKHAITDHPGPKLNKQKIHDMYLSQRVWDATMANAMLDALQIYGETIIHVIGQFHSNHDGGTVLSLLDRKSDLRILTLSLQANSSEKLKHEEKNKADIIIYVGPKPSAEK